MTEPIKQPEALLLADELDDLNAGRNYDTPLTEAAAELRRLHGEVEKFIPGFWGRIAARMSIRAKKAEAEVERLRALLRLDDAEWRDKHIHPCGGESFQSWLVSVYLPVPLSEQDKSPEAALERALKEPK